MARNEEKQLARLNRVYLQKQKDEELKKRPPRPRLESLTTPEDVKKWLPSITRDIEFYVKQMEVPCYRDQQIEEFSRRIGHLKGEYKAFLRKLRELDPENKITPWTDRPYAVKRQKVASNCEAVAPPEKDGSNNDADKESNKAPLPVNFIPLHTPILDNDDKNVQNFGYQKPVVAECPDLSFESMNQPLEFATTVPSVASKSGNSSAKLRKSESQSSQQRLESSGTCSNKDSCQSYGALNLPYSDSSSSGDET